MPLAGPGIINVAQALASYPATSAGGTVGPVSGIFGLNARIVMLGDSITSARGFAGFGDWGLFYTRGRYYGRVVGSNGTGPTGWNQGVVGNTTTHGIARLSNVAAESPKVVVILFGCNDITNSSGTFTSVTTNLRSLADSVKAMGATPVLCTIIPGSSSVYVGAMETTRVQCNDWIKLQTDCVICDLSATITDVATQLQADGKHPNATGAQLMGTALANSLSALITTSEILYVTGAIPSDNLYTNPLFTGGATVATGWTFFQNTNGLTKAASKTTLDGYEAQQYVASGTASANTADNFNQNVTVTGGLTGDLVEAWVEVLVTKATGITGICLSAGTNGTNTTMMSITAQDAATKSVPFRGVMRAPPSTLSSDGQVFNSRISILPANGATVDADITFSRAGYRRVVGI